MKVLKINTRPPVEPPLTSVTLELTATELHAIALAVGACSSKKFILSDCFISTASHDKLYRDLSGIVTKHGLKMVPIS